MSTRTTRAALTLTMLAAIAVPGCSSIEFETAPAENPEATERGEVVAVVDGDTIDVQIDEGKPRVRVIGIDTPEIGRGGAADECYAQEARTQLNDLIYGEPVDLIADPSQDGEDRYGRALRHVEHEGQSIAVTLLESGAGYEYTYDEPYAGHDQHTAAQDDARENARGLWGECE